jgi:predicted GNAT family N-acyltransferase
MIRARGTKGFNIFLTRENSALPIDEDVRAGLRNVDGLHPGNWTTRPQQGSDASRPAGFVGFLVRNQRATRHLIAGTFDTHARDADLPCWEDERPTGMYVWTMRTRSRPTPALYGPRRSGVHAAGLPSYVRGRGHGSKPTIAVKAAGAIEVQMREISIRSAVSVSKQPRVCPEVFDGNDFSSTHLVEHIGNEGAVWLWICCFADFAKRERLAVCQQLRNMRVGLPRLEAAIDLCQASGYQRLCGHAQKRLVKFRSQFGFEAFPAGQELAFSDSGDADLQSVTACGARSITIDIEPYLILRATGRWPWPGILEQSRFRPVTPSLGRARRGFGCKPAKLRQFDRHAHGGFRRPAAGRFGDAAVAGEPGHRFRVG